MTKNISPQAFALLVDKVSMRHVFPKNSLLIIDPEANYKENDYVIGSVALIIWSGVQKLRLLTMSSATDSSEESSSNSLISGIKIPFGPWLAIGGLFYYLALQERVDAYFQRMQNALF